MNRTLSSKDDEAKAIYKAQQGDLGAFNTLVQAHQEIAYGVAYRIVGERDTAADATQDSFLKAYRRLGQFRGGSFRAWVLRIVVNTCYDLLRARRRHPSCSLGGDGFGDEHEGYLPDGGESPEEFAIRGELNDRIQAALGGLPVDQRVVVILRDIEGVTYEEIAASTGMQLGTVKSRLSRGRARLRDLLREDARPADVRPERTCPGREALPAGCDARGKSAALTQTQGGPMGRRTALGRRGSKLTQREYIIVNNSSVWFQGPLRRTRFWFVLLAVLALALGSLVWPGTVSAQQLMAAFEFSPIGGSRATGWALVTDEGHGIRLNLYLAGLGRNAPSEAALTVGSCAQPGTNQLSVLSLIVDEKGRGQGGGAVTIGGT